MNMESRPSGSKRNSLSLIVDQADHSLDIPPSPLIPFSFRPPAFYTPRPAVFLTFPRSPSSYPREVGGVCILHGV